MTATLGGGPAVPAGGKWLIPSTSPLEESGRVTRQSALTLFLLLVCADVVFMSVHSIRFFTTHLSDTLYALGTDRGYAELYQYIKWFWIVVLLGLVSASRRSLSYVAWGLVFAYFLVDDAMRVHENVGRIIARRLALTPPLGLRLQDIGELVVSGTVGSVLFVLVTWAYLQGSASFKKISQDLLLLIFALIFCGVGIDMAEIAIGSVAWQLDFTLVVLEDGGEMLVASAIVWYLFRLALSDAGATGYLSDTVRAIFTRRSARPF